MTHPMYAISNKEVNCKSLIITQTLHWIMTIMTDNWSKINLYVKQAIVLDPACDLVRRNKPHAVYKDNKVYHN